MPFAGRGLAFVSVPSASNLLFNSATLLEDELEEDLLKPTIDASVEKGLLPPTLVILFSLAIKLWHIYLSIKVISS